MNFNKRFQDKNLSLTHFHKEVIIACPKCSKKAICTVSFENKIARLTCLNCGNNKEMNTSINSTISLKTSANDYFNASLWLITNFKNDVFWAYNYEHLEYLESYIAASLREHKDRTHYTLLEKLPKFYHEAKNRDSLLLIIDKLKNK